MKKKSLIIVCIILVVVCAGISIGVVLGLRGCEKNSQVSLLIGTWTEDSTGVEVTLTENGVFKILGNDAANYTYEKESDESGTITLVYAQVYGGQTVNMRYTVTSSKLTLTQESTGEVQTYSRTSSTSEE